MGTLIAIIFFTILVGILYLGFKKINNNDTDVVNNGGGNGGEDGDGGIKEEDIYEE